MVLLYSLLFVLLTGVGSILLASLFLIIGDSVQKRIISSLVSYASGCLLGAAFLGMIPHAVNESTIGTMSMSVLLGIVVFFLLEKLVIWRHCHKDHCDMHPATGTLILVGDGLHNFLDGIAITAGFMVSVPLGIATSVSIASHEIPQEVGDFAILLGSGYSRAAALRANIISGLMAVVGVVVGYFFLQQLEGVLPYFMSFAAAGFIWIAIADLLPALNRRIGMRESVLQFILILTGILTIKLLHSGHWLIIVFTTIIFKSFVRQPCIVTMLKPSCFA